MHYMYRLGVRKETRTATRRIKHETLAATSTTRTPAATEEIRDEEEEGIVRTSQFLSVFNTCISRAEQSDQIGWVPADEREIERASQPASQRGLATRRLQAKTKGNEGAGPTQSNPT